MPVVKQLAFSFTKKSRLIGIFLFEEILFFINGLDAFSANISFFAVNFFALQINILTLDGFDV